jgi:hypothetical protein
MMSSDNEKQQAEDVAGSGDKYLRLADLPPELERQMMATMVRFSVALLRRRIDTDGQDIVEPIGSGTLVTAGNNLAILTAAHVVELLDNWPFLGIAVSERGHRFFISQDHLRIQVIAHGSVEADGPDLAFIAVPATEAGTIKAMKSLYSLDNNRSHMLSSQPDWSALWATCGTPCALTDITENHDKRVRTISLKTCCTYGDLRRAYTIGDFDYIEHPVFYSAAQNVPDSFAGISGGGMWQISLGRRNGRIGAYQYLLSGVIFYQSPNVNSERLIKGHGIRSIYDKAYTAIAAFKPSK